MTREIDLADEFDDCEREMRAVILLLQHARPHDLTNPDTLGGTAQVLLKLLDRMDIVVKYFTKQDPQPDEDSPERYELMRLAATYPLSGKRT